jgi:hypothetical protein
MLSEGMVDPQPASTWPGLTGPVTTAGERSWTWPVPLGRLSVPMPGPRTAPFTYATVGLLLLTSALLHIYSADVDAVVGWASTNGHNLTHHPIAATLASAFVVPSGLLPELVIVAASFAVVERAIGTVRVVTVSLAGHIGATLITEGAVGLGIVAGVLPPTDLTRSDVGISYAMFAVVAASTLILRGRPRVFAVASVIAVVSVAAVLSPDMTAAGHCLSVLFGLGAMSLIQRARHPQSTDIGRGPELRSAAPA